MILLFLKVGYVSFSRGYCRSICAPRTIPSKPDDFTLEKKHDFLKIKSQMPREMFSIWLFLNKWWYPQIIHGLMGFSIINRPFWGPTPIFGNIHLFQGLILPYRLAVQLGPQLLILLPYMPRILRYITAIPHYEPNAGELRLAEMEFLKKVCGGAEFVGWKITKFALGIRVWMFGPSF